MIDLYLGDCRDKIKDIPHKSIDLILTDPPYNIASGNKLTLVGNKPTYNRKAWGNDFQDHWETIRDYAIWLDDIVSSWLPLLKDTGSIIMFLDRNYSGMFIVHLQNLGLMPRQKLYFEKLNPIPHFRKTNYRSCIEEAVWFSVSDNFTLNFSSQQEMTQLFKGYIGVTAKETDHPTEKYRWMIAPLILNHSNEGDMVFDPFAGSGTVPVICKSLQRDCIACELNPKFYKIMEQRMQQDYLF